MWLHIHLATVVRNASGITTTVAAFSYVCDCIITAISTVSLHIVRAPPRSNFACCLLSLFLLLLCLAHMRTAAWKSRSNSYINYTNNSNYNCHKEHGDFSTQLPIAVVVFLLPSTKRPQHAPAHLIAGKGVTTATCFFFPDFKQVQFTCVRAQLLKNCGSFFTKTGIYLYATSTSSGSALSYVSQRMFVCQRATVFVCNRRLSRLNAGSAPFAHP